MVKNILIVGGGVAGMEAARVASLRGHIVTLYEKNDQLGGHLIETSAEDFKEDNRRLLNWYKTRMEKYKVRVHLDVNVTPQLITENKSDVVIITSKSRLTTGST